MLRPDGKFLLEGFNLTSTSGVTNIFTLCPQSASAQCQLEQCGDEDRAEILSLQEKASKLKRKRHQYRNKCRGIPLLQKKLIASRGEVRSLQ